MGDLVRPDELVRLVKGTSPWSQRWVASMSSRWSGTKPSTTVTSAVPKA